ncbi:MAG TPA: hypothetical protein VKA00_04305 [Trueperaceae bacterium]|nr:hypothetical protein [Trueperaceae bacterium]
MSTLCLYVKPTATQPGTKLMSVTRLGPQWTGRRLRLREPERVGLHEADIIGWSDFYAGSACEVHVALATDGARSGWLVWGGTLGLRAVPAELDDVEAVRGGSWDARPLLWVEDPSLFPEDVRAVVAGAAAGDAATSVVAAGR